MSKKPEIDADTFAKICKHMDNMYPGASRTPSTPSETTAQSQLSILLKHTTAETPPSADYLSAIESLVPPAMGHNLGNIEPLCAISRANTAHLSSAQKLVYRLEIEKSATPILIAQYGGEGEGEGGGEEGVEGVPWGGKIMTDRAHPRHGRLWEIDAGTRCYVRLLSDIMYYYAEAGDWEQAAKWGGRCLDADMGDRCSLRERVGTYLVLAGRFEEALRFCVEWLRRGSGLQGKELRDLDPTKPLPTFLPPSPAHAPPHSHALLFTLSLCLHHLYPNPSTSTATSDPPNLPLAALLQADPLNPHTLRILLSPPSTYPTAQLVVPRAPGSREEASDYVFFTKAAWLHPSVQAWLHSLMESEEVMLGRKFCGGGCGKREGRVGEWKGCGGCQLAGRWYCGTECQKRDWERGHKVECKKIRKEKRGLEGLRGFGI